MAALTGGQALAGQLRAEDVRHVFGVPGVQLDWALDALREQHPALRYVHTRHEQAASYMADGYGRASGRPGVCLVVPGPGVLNALSGLATGWACSSPMVFLAAQIPSTALGRGLGALHEIPGQSDVLASLAKWHTAVRTPEQIPAAVHEAFRQVRSGRPRPVVVEIPADALSTRGDVQFLPAAEAEPAAADPADVERAATLLRAARRPLLYVGWGVQAAGAGEVLRQLAERLGAPVVMSANGRGGIDSRHPLAFGALEGRALRAEADLVLAVGTRFVTPGGEAVACTRARLVLINADERDLAEPRRPDVALCADARLALEALLEELPADSANDWGDLPAKARADAAARLADIGPQREILEVVRGSLPDDAVVVCDLTQIGYAAEVALPLHGPRTYLTAGFQGTLGFAFPTALGAKAADPGRPVVALVGDGGFGWALPELATARQHGLAVVTVVFNDGAFGNVRRIQDEQFAGRHIASDLVQPDFVELAEAYGIAAYRVDGPAALGGALRAAVAADEPALIEMRVGRFPSPWHLLRESIPAPAR